MEISLRRAAFVRDLSSFLGQYFGYSVVTTGDKIHRIKLC